MIVTHEQLKEIARSGGGLVADASMLSFEQMRELATAASTGQARVLMKKVSALTPAQLKALALLAPGLISFDLTT